MKAKVVSLLATHTEGIAAEPSGDNESTKFQAACSRFKRLFAMPEEEKLVNCKLNFVSNWMSIGFRSLEGWV